VEWSADSKPSIGAGRGRVVAGPPWIIHAPHVPAPVELAWDGADVANRSGPGNAVACDRIARQDT
jgi:hypothetical protein